MLVFMNDNSLTKSQIEKITSTLPSSIHRNPTSVPFTNLFSTARPLSRQVSSRVRFRLVPPRSRCLRRRRRLPVDHCRSPTPFSSSSSSEGLWSTWIAVSLPPSMLIARKEVPRGKCVNISKENQITKSHQEFEESTAKTRVGTKPKHKFQKENEANFSCAQENCQTPITLRRRFTLSLPSVVFFPTHSFAMGFVDRCFKFFQKNLRRLFRELLRVAVRDSERGFLWSLIQRMV